MYYYFNKWAKQGCWLKAWISLLESKRIFLDLSSLQLDGSHTPTKNGGDAVGYQGRKACKTTNSLFLYDNQGVMLSIATPQEGQHHDLFEIQTLFDELCKLLKKANINLDGLFLNADPGFDSEDLRKACEKEKIIPNVKPNPRNIKNENQSHTLENKHIFDELLYSNRTIIENSNAWLDRFKALLVRFEYSVRNWMALHFIAFLVIFLRKINKRIKV